MNISQNSAVLALVLLASLFTFTDCRRCGVAVSKKVAKEAAEESVEAATKKAGKASFRELGEKSVRTMKYRDFMTLLKREFPDVHSSFLRFDKSFQKDIVKAINRNPKALNAMLSSKTVLDEFVLATAKTPSISKNAGFFCYYVSHPQFASGVVMRQADNGIKFFSRSTDKLIGKYKDGIIEVVEPFAKDGRTFSSQILKDDLIPNTLYKVKGAMGTLYQLQTDALGNVVTAQGRNVTPEDLVRNILRRNSDVNLGEAWPTSYKRLKQYSDGADLNVHVKFNYTAENPNPSSVRVVAKRRDKEILNELFENTNLSVAKKYSPASNATLLKGLQKRMNIPDDKMITLQNLMDADEDFAHTIHSNPEFNVKRWLNTRNPVDEKLIARLPSGRFPPNAKTYAGNVFYFNPCLNPKLESRLSSKNGRAELKKAGIVSREQCEELDRRYPNGIPFSKSGFPDFSGVAVKGADGKPIIMDIGKLSGNSQKDIAIAEGMFRQSGYKVEVDYTWHHIEGTTSLLCVPTIIHQLVDHAGGMAMSRL